MIDRPLLTKSRAFALELIRDEIKCSQKERILTNQILRSVTSIGVNLHKTRYTQGGNTI